MAGKRIQTFREAKGLSRAAFAELMGVSATAVYMWERGLRTPTYERMLAIASALDVPRHLFFAEGLDGEIEG